MKLLEGLRLNPKKSFAGRIRGERLTRRKGVSIEFADYRDYSDGDDLRHLDWNVLARLETPIIKTYQDEEDLSVLVLLDASASMDFGNPPKGRQAAKLAAGLGYVGLCSQDAVRGITLGKREPPGRLLRGAAQYRQLALWASNQSFDGTAGLAASLRGIASGKERVGLAIVISDGLDLEVPGAVRALGGRGHEVLFLQVLSDVDLDPDIEGDLRLLDSESGARVEITANTYTLRAYRQALDAHCEALEGAVRKVGGRFERVLSSERFDSVLKRLRRGGWLAR